MRRGKRLRGAVRRARRRYALARKHSPPERVRQARKTALYWETLLRAFRVDAKRPYPHLSGDLDAAPEVLEKAERLARDVGRNFYVTSGYRSPAEQKVLYDRRHSNPYPVAFSDGRTCHSRHCSRRALDMVIGGMAIQHVIPAQTIRKHGLEPLAGDAVHLDG